MYKYHYTSKKGYRLELAEKRKRTQLEEHDDGKTLWYSSFIFFSSLCFIAQTDQSAISNDFVNDTCKKHEELCKICIDVIDSDPHQDLKLNLSGLLAIFINHSIANATDNNLYLVEQLKRPGLDNRTQQILNSCTDLYGRGINVLTSTLEALLENQGTELSMSMTGAYDMFVSCEYEYEYTPEPPAWLSRYLGLRPLLELSMGTANLIECKRVAACVP